MYGGGGPASKSSRCGFRGFFRSLLFVLFQTPSRFAQKGEGAKHEAFGDDKNSGRFVVDVRNIWRCISPDASSIKASHRAIILFSLSIFLRA